MDDTTAKVRTFPDRRKLIAAMPKNAICAEIGVHVGKFSDKILNLANPKKLHLIDCWSLSEDPTPHITMVSERMWEAAYDDVVERYQNEERVEINRGMSNEVLPTFPDDYFDWVYVDANHGYLSALEDLQNSYQKVKDRGFILGHDMNLPGVRRAVYEMMNSRQCEMAYCTREQPYFSYGLRVLK